MRALVVGELAADDEPPVLERMQQIFAHALLGCPGEGQPFDAVGVRVLRRGEAALGQPELAEQVVERLLDDSPVALLPGDDPGVEIRGREQRVVVEHLLEVRDEPALVDRVAVEAAADEVVHPAGGHRVERRGHHRQRVLVAAEVHAEQELDRRGLRELGRAAPASPSDVELRAKSA